MICRCIICNEATIVSLRRGERIANCRCYCGASLVKATVTFLDGEHPNNPAETRIGEYGERKGKPYFRAFKSEGDYYIKTAGKFYLIQKV